MMLKYGMKKMPRARAAMKGLAALFFAAMMLCGAMAAGETDPLRPDDLSYDNGNIVLHKQAKRIGQKEWQVDVSATIKNKPVEPPKLEVVFVLDVSSTMNACAVMDQHNAFFNGGSTTHTHTENCPEGCDAVTHSHVSGYYNSVCEKKSADGIVTAYPRRFDVARGAISELVSKLPTGTRVVYTYFSDIKRTGEIPNYGDLLDPDAYGLYFNIQGQTYIMNGVDFGISKFSSNSDTEKILVLVTDGQATDERYSSTALTSFNGTVFTVGFNHDDPNLKGMAKNGGDYYTATNPGELTEAFDDIAYKITTMIVDPMGEMVDFAGQSSVSMGILTEADDIIKWAPDDGDKLVNNQVTYSYKVKLTDDADTSTAQTNSGIPLNDTTVFRYSITTNGTTQEYERRFPIPQATYAVSSVQVQWKAGDMDLKDPTDVESIICDWPGAGFETDYTTIVGEFPGPDADTKYTYDYTTYTANGITTSSIDASESVAYVVTHYYKLAPNVTTGRLKITKTATGATVPEDTKFTITGLGSYSKTIAYSDFTNGEYTLSDLPVGTYTVTEDTDSAKVENYTLTVEGSGNSATVTKDGDASVAITNRYTKSVGNLKVSKTVVSGDETKAFTFAVSPAENGGVSADAWNAWKAVKGNSAEFSLKHNESHTLRNLPLGKYTVTETNVPAGYTPDQAAKTVEVTNDDNASVGFVNTYAVGKTTATLSVTKELTGRDMTAGEFSFELKNATGGVLQTKQNAANGSVTFDPITYNTAGEYAYTISEIVPTDKAGVRYDTDTVSATVTVTDNGDGTLSADVEYADNDVTFINEYVPLAAEVVFTASKELTGRTLNAGEFSFELKNATGGVLQTKQNAANGSVTFDPITYETAGTHTYTISEVQGNLVGVTYDKNAYSVSVEVTDDGKGKLTAVTTGAEGIVFKNTYEANGSFIFRARKELQGCELKQGMFSFELKDPKTGKTLQTKSNDKDGLVVFDALAYTQEHIGETFTYTISEVDDQNDFFTHDPTVHQVSVTVSVADDGRLSMETRGVPQSGEVQFVNAVLPTEFTVTKIWEGGDGEISLTLYADGEKLDPQPVCTRDGNVYTYTGLPICDMEGKRIVYWAVETPVKGFMTVYRNSGAFVNETSWVYNGGQIINRALTDVRVRKVWNGLRSDEVRPPITLTLYRNGVKMNVPTPAPDKDGWYTFPGLLMNDNGKAVVYTVKEEPVQGFVTTYINNGVESTDCAQNGGTIVNSKIPSTGDRSDLAFWMTMLAASGALLALTAVCRRKRMN